MHKPDLSSQVRVNINHQTRVWAILDMESSAAHSYTTGKEQN